MPHRVILVHLPSIPFARSALLPKPFFWRTAGLLRDSGVEVAAHDLGSIETMTRLYPLTAPARASLLERRLGVRRHVGTLSRLVEEIVTRSGPDLTAIHVASAASMPMAKPILRAIGQCTPRAVVVCQCDSAALGKVGYRSMGEVHLVQDPERAAHAIREALHGAVSAGRARAESSFTESADSPAASRLRVFTIDAGETPETSVALHALTAVRRIEECEGPSAYYFASHSSRPNAALTASREILRTRARVRYCCDLRVFDATAQAVAALHASGCAAVGLHVHTGSQRQLDRVYDAGFTVTEAEHAVQRCKAGGLHTTVYLAHPSADDDYHTRDETIRLLRRSNPDAVVLHARPDSSLERSCGIRPRGGRRRASRERRLLYAALVEAGYPMGSDPVVALMANLAGYAGREREFAAMFDRQLETGDAIGAAATVARVNRGAFERSHRSAEQSRGDFPDVVGN